MKNSEYINFVRGFGLRKKDAHSWDRTNDLSVNSRALYLLSYTSLGTSLRVISPIKGQGAGGNPKNTRDSLRWIQRQIEKSSNNYFIYNNKV